MTEGQRLHEESGTLQGRLEALNEAIKRISEDLGPAAVLREVAHGARALTEADCSVVLTVDTCGKLADMVTSGMDPESERELLDLRKSRSVLEYLTGLESTLRTDNLVDHVRSAGITVRGLPFKTFMSTRIQQGEKHVGNICVGGLQDTLEFNVEHKQALEAFTAQTATAIVNGRRHDYERGLIDILGMASHKLRGPLTSIKGSAATVREAPTPLDPAETLQFLRIIEEQADHMRDLINSLLDLTRAESSTLSIAPQPNSVLSLIEEARNAFLSTGYRNSIQACSFAGLPFVKVDRLRIVQVLLSLLTNVSRYSPEWSAITVEASQDDAHVSISVSGEGVGIPFQPLTDSSRGSVLVDSRVDQGNNLEISLELAVCRGIVEAHGGVIWAESGGHGTRFTFTVPAFDRTSRIHMEPLGSDAVNKQSKQTPVRRILAIDTDPHILSYLRRTLSEAGFAPLATTEPGEVENLLMQTEPHLLLLDIELPGIDGFEVLKEVRSDFNLPVILLSGEGSGLYISKAFEKGAADFLVKPFSPAELVARVKAALRNHAIYEQIQSRQPFTLGDLSINYVERSVSVYGRTVELTPTEYKLLFELSTNAGRALTHEHLIRRIWGDDQAGSTHLLRSFIKTLRNKLGDDAKDPTFIFTLSGVGYRMADH